MAKRNRRLLVPEAKAAVKQLKLQVMRQEGYNTNAKFPDDVKYEVARDLHVPLTKGYNGTLTSKQAGKVGGKIGGSMVKEMIQLAQNNLNNNKNK